MNYKNIDKKTIYSDLTYKYYNYYYSVYYEFIIEAIENTMKDLRKYDSITIDMIHNNIKENYI
jgi:hypothetical protein